MPLKLREPQAGRTPYYQIRGTYLGVRVEQSTGTSNRKLASDILRQKREDIERGAVARPGEPSFAEAAINYMTAGGEAQFLAPIIRHFGTLALPAIDQAAIDRAAAALYPNATPATRNRQVYTPISAVLKRAGIERAVKRPIGWRGQRRTGWLTKEQVFALLAATDHIDATPESRREYRALLVLLCYTGMRLGDALGLEQANVDFKQRTALLPDTKNGRPRLTYLPKHVADDLKGLPETKTGRVFRFHNGGWLRGLFKQAAELAKIELPDRVAFHILSHTWATWMRQYGKLDTADLLATDRWADEESARQYAHVVVSDIAKRADLLPVPKRKAG
jgi:integrase